MERLKFEWINSDKITGNVTPETKIETGMCIWNAGYYFPVVVKDGVIHIVWVDENPHSLEYRLEKIDVRYWACSGSSLTLYAAPSAYGECIRTNAIRNSEGGYSYWQKFAAACN